MFGVFKVTLKKVAFFFLGIIILNVILTFYGKRPDYGQNILMATSLIRGCASVEGQNERYNCYALVLREGVSQYGLGETSSAFKNYVESEEGIPLRGGACHSLGHDIGQAAIMAGYTNEEILATCPEICQEGCFNGVGHTYIALHKADYDIDEFCNPKSVTVNQKRILACYHGFGHGITDVFGVNLERSLKICDSIRDPGGRYQCGHAIFMILSTVPSETTEDLNIPRDMKSFCANLDQVYKNSCFVFAGYLTFASSKNIVLASEACNKVPSEFKTECIERIGESLVIMHPNDLEKVKNTCARASGKQFSICMGGAAKTFAVSLNSPVENSFQACKSTDAVYQESCYQSLGTTLEIYRGKEDRKKYCTDLGGKFINSCLGF